MAETFVPAAEPYPVGSRVLACPGIHAQKYPGVVSQIGEDLQGKYYRVLFDDYDHPLLFREYDLEMVNNG